MGYGCSVCTKAMRQDTMSLNFKKRKANLSHLKIKTVLEPETVMSSSKTAVALPQQSDAQFILVEFKCNRIGLWQQPFYVYVRLNINAYIHILNGSPVNKQVCQYAKKCLDCIHYGHFRSSSMRATELHNVCQWEKHREDRIERTSRYKKTN